MPLTSTERSRILRKAREKEGLKEVRGIWLAPELHNTAKELARGVGDSVRVGDVVSYIADERVIHDEVLDVCGDVVKLNVPYNCTVIVHRNQIIKIFREVKV